MSIYDEDWGEVRTQPKTFVPAVYKPDATSIRQMATPLVQAMPTNGEIDGGALRAMESGEKSTPVQRGVGAAITLVAFLVAGILVAWMLANAGAGTGVAVFAFLACAVIGGYLVWVQVTMYSPSGVELDKSARYENIRLAEIESNERIALRKLEAYMQVLEKVWHRED